MSKTETYDGEPPTLAESRLLCEQLNMAIAEAYAAGVDPESLLTVLMVAAVNIEHGSLGPGSAKAKLAASFEAYEDAHGTEN